MKFDEDEWDLNKKAYLVEIKRSNKEKKISLAALFVLVLAWFTIIQGSLIEYGQYE